MKDSSAYKSRTDLPVDLSPNICTPNDLFISSARSRRFHGVVVLLLLPLIIIVVVIVVTIVVDVVVIIVIAAVIVTIIDL